MCSFGALVHSKQSQQQEEVACNQDQLRVKAEIVDQFKADQVSVDAWIGGDDQVVG